MTYRIGGRLEKWLERRVTEETRREAVEILNAGGSFGERLRQLRHLAGLHQKDIVQQLRLPQDRMSDLERGNREPTEHELSGIADLFGIERNLLLK